MSCSYLVPGQTGTSSACRKRRENGTSMITLGATFKNNKKMVDMNGKLVIVTPTKRKKWKRQLLLAAHRSHDTVSVRVNQKLSLCRDHFELEDFYDQEMLNASASAPVKVLSLLTARKKELLVSGRLRYGALPKAARAITTPSSTPSRTWPQAFSVFVPFLATSRRP